MREEVVLLQVYTAKNNEKVFLGYSSVFASVIILPGYVVFLKKYYLELDSLYHRFPDVNIHFSGTYRTRKHIYVNQNEFNRTQLNYLQNEHSFCSCFGLYTNKSWHQRSFSLRLKYSPNPEFFVFENSFSQLSFNFFFKGNF